MELEGQTGQPAQARVNAPTLDWGAGSYESVAAQLLPAARVVVESAGLRPGERVLDLGCGTGNAALDASRGRALLRGFSSWSILSALEMMDRQGIAAAVLSMVMWSGLFGGADDVAARRLARSSNEVAAEAIRGHPDRFGGFACLPLPDVDGALAEIDYGLGTLGLDGVVLLTNASGVYLGNSRLDPVSDELNRRRAAGAVVIRDVPDFALVAGVPARWIGWVGRAGVRLLEAGDGLWRCPQTAELHREQDGALVMVAG